MIKNILALFLDKLLSFPLWVKQVIYLRLYKNLASFLSEDFIQTKEEDLFHLHVPTLSFVGRTELAERKGNFDDSLYTFLTNVVDGLNILEISMNNFWTMEEVAKYYVFCLEQNYIKVPESKYVEAIAGFIAGKLRLGEYFKHIGKINVDQLEQIIIKNREYSEKGTPKKMAEIMIELELVSEKDTSSLLLIKEESKKRFILDASIVPKAELGNPHDLKSYQDKITKLTEQNQLLKDQLSKILALVKKHG